MSIAAGVRVCLLRISRSLAMKPSLGMKPYSSSEWSRMLLILCIHIMYISKLVIYIVHVGLYIVHVGLQ